jgi:hypothetical protein
MHKSLVTMQPCVYIDDILQKAMRCHSQVDGPGVIYYPVLQFSLSHVSRCTRKVNFVLVVLTYWTASVV